MSTLTEARPAPVTTRTSVWAVSDGGAWKDYFYDTRQAAAFIADKAMAQHRTLQLPSVTVQRRNADLDVLWDASADVASVFTATGWPTLIDTAKLRADVVDILTAVLVTDDTSINDAMDH